MSVDNTQKVVASVSDLVMDIVAIAQGGLKIGSLSRIFALINDIKSIIESAPGSFPELKSIDAHDAGVLGEMAYNAVFKLINDLKNSSLIKHG
jgi:hypothetical protein